MIKSGQQGAGYSSDCLPNIKPLFQSLALHKLGMVVHACNYKYQQMGAKESEVYDHLYTVQGQLGP